MLSFSSFTPLLIAVLDFWYIWLPVILVLVFWNLWVYYVRARYISRLEWVLLEIKLPREIHKGPRAMEVVFNMLHQTRDAPNVNIFERYWQGFVRAWFSLEVVSIEGKIHLYVYTQRFFRNLVEAQIYAQYPDVEIVEVGDYTKFFRPGFENEWRFWGTEFKLTAEDAYPIKTYVDYDLQDLATKEEQKTDPLTSFLEFLGSLKTGEQVWFQIAVRATRKDWREEGKKLVEKIMKEKEELVKRGEGETISLGVFRLTPGERAVIEAIERDVSKLGFDVGIRTLYFAKKEIFNFINVVSLLGLLKQYNALNLNGFRPTNSTVVDYFKKLREPGRRVKMLDAYRHRSFFYTPYVRPNFVLNSEELATIFHFPGRVAETPTLARIEAKRSEAPPNLPI